MEVKKQINTSTIKGEVTYDMPPYEERVKLTKETQQVLLNAKEDKKDGEGFTSGEMDAVFTYSQMLVDIARKYLKDIKLEAIEGTVKINSIDELLNYEEGQPMVGEFANTILNGIKLGNEQGN